MKGKNYQRILLAGSLLVIAIVCLGQAITTKELMLARTQNSAPITDLAATGAANQPPSAKSLTPDREGPQMAGSTIIWTGNAYDPDGDRLLYQFWLNGPLTGNAWKSMTGWTENNTWNWTTSPIDSGLNIIDMRIRDERHSAPWGHDSHISAEYVIDSNEGIGQSSRAEPGRSEALPKMSPANRHTTQISRMPRPNRKPPCRLAQRANKGTRVRSHAE